MKNKPIYKLMDSKGRVLIPKELRIASGMDYGDIVRLELLSGRVSVMHTFESANRTSDIIISTGGVSAGQKDLVPDALKRLGAEIVFHGVSLKPGMPAVFAILNGKPVLALSGNPFACAVTFEALARPALAVLASDKRIKARKNQAVLTEGFDSVFTLDENQNLKEVNLKNQDKELRKLF